MKKFLIIILMSIICVIPVQAKESVTIESIKAVKSSDGVVLNDKNQVNATFNDLNQQVKYEAILKNNTDTALYVNFLEVENSSQEFMEYKLDTKSENMLLEPNGSSKITFYVNTLAIEGAGRNLDDQVNINFKISDEIYNPNTNTDIFDVVILLLILLITIYFVRKNKKAKVLILLIGISIIGINYVSAKDYITVTHPGNIKYTSQNLITTTGTVLSGTTADYTNSKEVWAYYDKVKNIEIKSLINEPKKYYKKFDLTENKTGRVMAYLIENNDKDTPYDLNIMSQGVVIANQDSSFLFSFPKTEKVEGLSNIDFSETTTMQGMFIGNEKLKTVEVEAIELNNTVDTSYMFYDCEEIEHEKSDFDLTNVTNTNMMFIPYLYNEVKNGAKVEIDENFTKSPSETNLIGNFIRKDTLEDEYPIYYYRGPVTDNNVKFAGFCWQIVRTTDTGGIKLVYNGTPNSDGTCKEPGIDITIGNSVFNSKKNTIASAGYMYGKQYLSSNKILTNTTQLYDGLSMSNNTNQYYYSKTYEYKDGKYILMNPETKIWSESYNELDGYYTCRKTIDEPCDSLYYIFLTNIYSQYAYKYTNGETPQTDKLVFGKNYIKNSDGTYELTNKVEIMKQQWEEKSNSMNDGTYYACQDAKTTKCNQIYILSSSTIYLYNLEKIETKVYGNDVEYINGEYVLKDTYTADNWVKNYDKLAEKYHYTCLNTTGKCKSVYYFTEMKSPSTNTYLTLTDGKKIDDVMEEMFSNETNSDIKTYIDNWYKNNLINYTNQLEDTVWCNDRSLTGILTGKDVNGKDETSTFGAGKRLFTDIPNQMTLDCPQLNDSFTVSKENGNGALTYPIAMLTADEVMLSGYGFTYYNYAGESYLSSQPSRNAYHVMTPDYITTNGEVYAFEFNGCGMLGFGTMAYTDAGVRPAISLIHNIKYTSGDGTKENPYIIE